MLNALVNCLRKESIRFSTKTAQKRGFAIPSFLKTNECLFPLKSMQYPSIKSAISSALASEKVVNTRGCKEKDERKTNVGDVLFTYHLLKKVMSDTTGQGDSSVEQGDSPHHLSIRQERFLGKIFDEILITEILLKMNILVVFGLVHCS